ncbi:MAG: hypothetical protein IRZ21_12655 [Thermoleophilaceae bacterium]|nr:hypothetical protein [Thermoleophilaceae bacterium]
MVLPRPALLAILGFLLIGATFLATHRGSSDSGGEAATAVAKQPAQRPATHRTAAAKPATGASKARDRRAPARKAPARDTRASSGMPLGVARALARHRVVVLLLRSSGADDDATAAAVRRLEGTSRSRVAVFSGKLSDLADYRRIVEGLDISQAPSTVVVGRDRKARLLEGFVDFGSLRQVVADVAR